VFLDISWLPTKPRVHRTYSHPDVLNSENEYSEDPSESSRQSKKKKAHRVDSSSGRSLGMSTRVTFENNFAFVLVGVSIACYTEPCISYGRVVRPSVCRTPAPCQNDASYDQKILTGD